MSQHPLTLCVFLTQGSTARARAGQHPQGRAAGLPAVRGGRRPGRGRRSPPAGAARGNARRDGAAGASSFDAQGVVALSTTSCCTLIRTFSAPVIFSPGLYYSTWHCCVQEPRAYIPFLLALHSCVCCIAMAALGRVNATPEGAGSGVVHGGMRHHDQH